MLWKRTEIFSILMWVRDVCLRSYMWYWVGHWVEWWLNKLLIVITENMGFMPLRCSYILEKPDVTLESSKDCEAVCLRAVGALVVADSAEHGNGDQNDEVLRKAIVAEKSRIDGTPIGQIQIDLEDWEKESMQGAANITLSRSIRELVPVNEITSRDTLLGLAFPDVFILS